MRGKSGEMASGPRLGAVATWLLIVFAAGLLAFLTWNADAPDVIGSSVLILPWIVGPAAVAALLAARAWSRVEAWFFLVAELAAVASTVALGAMLSLNSGHENAQSGIALLMLPLVQFPAVLAYAWLVTALAPAFRRKPVASA